MARQTFAELVEGGGAAVVRPHLPASAWTGETREITGHTE